MSARAKASAAEPGRLSAYKTLLGEHARGHCLNLVGSAVHGGESQCGTVESESRYHQLHSQSGLVYSHQRLDGGSLWHAARVQRCRGDFHVVFRALRAVAKCANARRGTHPAGDRFAVMGALHHAFLTLGALTMISSLSFWTLRAGDGESVSKGSTPPDAG